jgi:RNA polymerase II elongation factor ELL
LKQEKEAKQANITNSLIPAPKNRYDAARKERLVNKATRPGVNGLSRPSSPPIGAISSPRLGAGPTSAPTNEEDLKLRAMRTPLIHLLASESLRSEEIVNKTHIPKEELHNILQRVGKQGEAGKWQLSDKAFRDLDVWKFDYPSKEKRHAAIDNAVRAYDRMRVERDNRLWQLLLPKEERGKGTVLSRLHLGGGQMNRGLTPSYQPSLMPHMDGTNDSRAASAVNTPKHGPSTPRPSSSAGDVRKRLLAKDPQKARAAEDAKEKKRKEREAPASDREGGKPAKKQATKKTNVKSEEFVHSSDDESDEEPIMHKRAEQSQSSPEKAKAPAKVKSKAVISTSSDSSDTALKDKAAAKATAKAKPAARAADSPAVKPARPTTAGKSTPKTTNNLSAPNSQQRSQRSPSNPGNRPNVPSPLGAARPRVASDVSDRGAVGVQKARQGAETPKGLGITEASKKHHDTTENTTSSKQNDKSRTSEKQQEPTANGSGTPKSLVNGAGHKADAGVKRKADQSPAQEAEPSTKHRKTDSTSSQAPKPQANSSMAANGINHTSPNGSGSDTADSVLESITYNQGVKMAEKYREYYAAYDKEYEAQQATETRGGTVSAEDRRKLWDMHKVLARMKKEMKAAAERENA